MPQLDTTYFVSQIFWLCILFTLFYLSVRYLIAPRLESIIKARILVKEDSDKLAKQYEEEIEKIKKDHLKKAEEVRHQVQQMQLESNKKFEEFSKKAEAGLHSRLDKKMSESEAKIDKFTKDFNKSKDTAEVISYAASKIIEEASSIKVDKNKLKKYMEA